MFISIFFYFFLKGNFNNILKFYLQIDKIKGYKLTGNILCNWRGNWFFFYRSAHRDTMSWKINKKKSCNQFSINSTNFIAEKNICRGRKCKTLRNNLTVSYLSRYTHRAISLGVVTKIEKKAKVSTMFSSFEMAITP